MPFFNHLHVPTIKRKQTNTTGSHHYFSHMAFVFVPPASTLRKGIFYRTYTKLQLETALKMGISPLPTVSFASFEGTKSCKDVVHLRSFM